LKITGFLLLAGLAPWTLAAQPVPLGPETLVSDDTAVFGFCPRAAAAADGSLEIAWEGGSPPFRILSRHYDASGSPAGAGPIQIGSFDHFEGIKAVTAVSGGFRVLTGSGNDAGVLPGMPALFHQILLGPSGAPEPAGPRPVGSRDTFWIWPGPGDTLLAGRDLIGKRVLQLQRVSPAGKPSRPFVPLNSQPVFDHAPSVQVIPLADGGWIAVWFAAVETAPGSVQYAMRARRFSAAGKPLGQELAPLGGRGGANAPVVVADPSGGFAVASQITDYPFNNPNNPPVITILLRFFDAAGRPRGPEALVAQGTSLSPPAAAAFDGSGHLLLLWSDAGSRIQAQLFGTDGNPVGPAFQPASDGQTGGCPGVVWTGDSWAITWLGRKSTSTEGSIFLRRFRE
jgi:hypothetical protein